MNSRVTCSEDVLSAYLDGECTEDERAAVESAARVRRRVAGDPRRRSARRARLVRVVAAVEPPAGFIESLIDAPVTPTYRRAGCTAAAGARTSRRPRRGRRDRCRLRAGVAPAATPTSRRRSRRSPIRTAPPSRSSRTRSAAWRRSRRLRVIAAVRAPLLLVAAARSVSRPRHRWSPPAPDEPATAAPSGPTSSTKPGIRWSPSRSTAWSSSSGTTPTGSHAAQMEVRQHDGRGRGRERRPHRRERRVERDARRPGLDDVGGRHGGGAADSPRGKYEVERSAGPVDRRAARRRVTRRSATATSSSDCSCRTLRGLVLRREVLDADGDVARSVSFMRVERGAGHGRVAVDGRAAPGPRQSTTSIVRIAIPRPWATASGCSGGGNTPTISRSSTTPTACSRSPCSSNPAISNGSGCRAAVSPQK